MTMSSSTWKCDDGLHLDRVVKTTVKVGKTDMDVSYQLETIIKDVSFMNTTNQQGTKFKLTYNRGSLFLDTIAIFDFIPGKSKMMTIKYVDNGSADVFYITLWNNKANGTPKIHPYHIVIENVYSDPMQKMIIV